MQAALGVLMVCCVCIGALYLGGRNLFTSAREAELTAIANTAALSINGDLHQKVRQTGSWRSKDYDRASLPLAKIRASNPQIKYIYTVYLSQETPRFVLDPTPAGDSDKDGVDDKSYPNQAYDDATPAMRQALYKQISTVEPHAYTDRWGTFISAYAPFYDSNGRFEGLVGVDMAQEVNLARQAKFDLKFKLALMLSVALALLTYLLVFRGAKKIRAHEEALLSAQIELTQANELLEQRVAQRTFALQNAIQTKDTFLANMSHEMRTPLNGIIGLSGLLMDTELSQDQREYVESVERSGHHLLELVSDILVAAQIRHAGIELDPKPTNINAEIERACESLRLSATNLGQEMMFDLDPKLSKLHTADSLRLRQIVTNLVGNAVKFNSQGGVIYISSSALDSGTWVLQVMDTGIGIASDKIASIYEEFTQVDASSTRRHGGTGLGLTITKGLVELMGGRIDVESTLGKGSTFIVSLPLIPDEEEEAA
ncbi:MAG: ATP-binding protein [Fimbriimonadaceae bacterium]